jgi:hypothetical protein
MGLLRCLILFAICADILMHINYFCYMSDLNIPGWAVVLIGAGGGLMLGWMLWLTRKQFDNEKAIAVNTAKDAEVGSQITDLKSDFKERIDKLERHMNASFDKIFNRIDQITRR